MKPSPIAWPRVGEWATEGIQPSILDEIVETLNALRERQHLTLVLVEQTPDEPAPGRGPRY